MFGSVIKPWMSYVLGGLLILSMFACGVQTYRLAIEQRDHQKTIAENELEWTVQYKTSAEAAKAGAALYAAQTERLQKEANDAKTQRDKASSDAAANARAGDKLRKQLAEARASSGCTTIQNPTADNRSKAAGTSVNLFDYVQRRLDEAADGIARFADESSIAGRACERSYDALN